MILPSDCDPTFKAALRANKPALLALLRLNFVLCKSDVLKETVIFADSEETKAALVAGGADPRVVYAPDELRLLTSQRISAKDLLVAHAAKKRFSGKVVP
jgi:hypothetical protein